MTPIPPNDSYNKMSHFLQNDDLQTFFVLNNGMVTTRVMESINTNFGHLNLTNTKLDLFASDIFHLSMFRDHLYKLSLGKNLLRWIPKSIGNLSVLNHLDLSKNQLTSLPESIGNLSTLNNLNLSKNRLTSLPESIGSLSTLNNLNLSWNQLTSLPESISSLLALNNLNLSENRLTSLPESIGSLSVLNNLNLSWNQLTSLPESIGSLSALNNLNLLWNELTSLPESIGSLSALNNLNLSGNELISLPGSIGNLRELRVLDLSYNPNLSSLPKEILNLPNTCIIDINGCNFSPTVLDRLQETTSHPDYIGPQISHSMMNTNPNIEMPTIEESLQHFYTIINKVPNELLELNRTETLCIWLHRLCHIDDYRKSQKEFITKIISYLEKANADEEFRNIFFITIDDAVETCEDKVALSVLQLGINYQLETIAPNNIRELAYFLINGVWALEILHGIAREKMKHCPFFDAIEVYLGYPIKLKEQLNLPIDVTNMLFFNYSGLTPLDLETAKNIVLATITDQNELPNFLISQPKWVESLKQNYEKEYLSIIHTKDNDGNSDNPDYMKIKDTYETELKSLTMKVLDSLKTVIIK